MKNIKTPGETRDIGRPANWNETDLGRCGSLSVCDMKSHNGLNMMVSTWVIEEPDAALIAKGAPIHLAVYGHVHPVISMYVGDPAHGEPVALSLDALISAIPPNWFLYGLGEAVRPIKYAADAHWNTGYWTEVQHRRGGMLTKGVGTTQKLALMDAIKNIDLARAKEVYGDDA